MLNCGGRLERQALAYSQETARMENLSAPSPKAEILSAPDPASAYGTLLRSSFKVTK